MTVVAELIAVIGADINPLTAGLNKAKGLLGGFAALTAASLGFKEVVGSSMDFTKILTNVQATAGLSTAAIGDLKSQILAMGADSEFTSDQMGNAFYDIVGGVQDASSWMSIFKASMDTAEAGQADLKATTQGLIFTMNAYGLSAKDATMVSDVLTRTVGVGVGTMNEFVPALASVAGTAKLVGIEFKDLGAMAAFITTKGFSASEATTQLQSVMQAILKPNSDMEKALESLGFATGSAALKQLGFIGTLKALSKASGGSSDAMAQMFGRIEGFKGVMALTDAGFTEFNKNFEKGRVGATAMAKAIQELRPDVAISKFLNFLNTLAIRIGDVVAPSVAELANVLRELIGDFVELNPSILPAIAGVLAAGTAMLVATTIATGLAAAIGFLLTPVGLVIAGVAALGAAWATNFGGIRDLVMPIIGRIGDAFKAFQAQLGDFVSNVKKFGLGKALASALNLGDGKKYASGWIQGVLEALGMGKDQAGAAVTGINNVLQSVVQAFESLKTMLAPITSVIGNFFNTLFGPGTLDFATRLSWAIDQAAALLPGAIGALLGNIGQFILDNAPRVAAAFMDLLGQIGGWISTNANKVLNGFGNLFEDIANWVSNGGLDKLIGGLGGLIAGAAEWFTTKAWPALQEGVKSLFGSAQSWIGGSDGLKHFTDGFGKLITAVGGWIANSAWPSIQSFFKTFFDSIGTWIANGENGGGAAFVKGIGDAVIAAGNWVSQHGWETVLSLFTSFVDEMGKFISKSGIDKFVAGIGDGIRAAAKWIGEEGWPLIRDAFGKIFKWIGEELGKIGTGWINSITETIDKIRGIQTGELSGSTKHFKSSDIEAGLQGWQDLFSGFASSAGFAGGGWTGSGPSSSIAGPAHFNEWVVPENGALVLRGDSGYSGPSIIRVELRADNFVDFLDIEMAKAMNG